ncbi:uncharacterized protein N7529_008039 [Penicillium soppii]|uniref:uncharacterized protein n=1 Tax=Penicillium soppii TaxID=69789 RepID=UPI002548BDC5|nr:uncharacterized protein N7529_008039 [Penicillium soppii]KAJ5860729.1 hypothetical protein N7529_008039 [Penicillium soppii]
MKACPEFMKSDMATSSVSLGLAPATLAVLGSNIDQISLLPAVGKCAFLAIMLAAGSPAVAPLRPVERRNPLEALELSEDDHDGLMPTLFSSHLIAIIDYGFVLATSYEL